MCMRTVCGSKQILYNLLSNAVKFTPNSGRIIIECFDTDGFIGIAVSDTGVGIHPQEQDAVSRSSARSAGELTYPAKERA